MFWPQFSLTYHPEKRLNELCLCELYSTGCPSSSGLYSILVPWSGGVSWVLLQPTSEIFAAPPGHQRLQFTPLIGTALCSFCSYLHNPGPCILGGWSLCVEWASFGATIAPGFFLTHSTLVSKLFFLAVQGSGALLSSNPEGALYKSP